MRRVWSVVIIGVVLFGIVLGMNLDTKVGNPGLPAPSDEFSKYVQDLNKSTYDPFYISPRQAREIADFESHEQTVKQTLKDSFTVNNNAVKLYEYVNRKLTYDSDPNFVLAVHITKLRDGVPIQYWHKFNDCESLGEAEALRGTILERVAAERRLSFMGIHAMGAGLVAVLMDVTTILGALVLILLVRIAKAALARLRRDQGGRGHLSGRKHQENEEVSANKTLSNFVLDFRRIMSMKLSWSQRTTLEKSHTILIILFIITILPLPYESYITIRVVVFICLFYFFQAIRPIRQTNRWPYFMIVLLLILYNPIIPIHFGSKLLWTVINVTTIYFAYRFRSICSEN